MLNARENQAFHVESHTDGAHRSSLHSSGHQSKAARRRVAWALIVATSFELLLIAVTWRLWFGTADFPRVPLISNIGLTSSAWCAASGVLLVIALSAFAGFQLWALCIGPDGQSSIDNENGDQADLKICRSSMGHRRVQRLTVGAVLAAAIAVVAANQHCLQAWHWLLILLFTAAQTSQTASTLTTMRLIIGSVYVFSALSRICPTIEDSMTGNVTRMLLQQVSIASTEQQIRFLCWILVGGELLTGVLLQLPRGRLTAMMMALILHTLLLISLGPLGLNHHVGVLLWNACFLCIVPLLSWPLHNARQVHSVEHRDVKTGPSSTPGRRVARAAGHTSTWQQILLRLLVIAFPLGGLFGISDNWPSWQLYSPRPEIWKLQVLESTRTDLPQPIRPFVKDPAPLDEWCDVRIDRWSLAATAAPIYPEDRFQLAVIRLLVQDLPAGSWRIRIDEPARLYWRPRNHRTISNSDELSAAGHAFLLNAEAR